MGSPSCDAEGDEDVRRVGGRSVSISDVRVAAPTVEDLRAGPRPAGTPARRSSASRPARSSEREGAREPARVGGGDGGGEHLVGNRAVALESELPDDPRRLLRRHRPAANRHEGGARRARPRPRPSLRHPWSERGGTLGAGLRLTTCCKPGSFTPLRSQVNEQRTPVVMPRPLYPLLLLLGLAAPDRPPPAGSSTT